MKLDLMKGLCSLPLPHSVVGWSVVCDCGISWSSDRYGDPSRAVNLHPVTGTATQTLMVATGSLDSSADHLCRYYGSEKCSDI